MYYPVQIPRLSKDLMKRLFPLCQRLRVPMAVFVNEAIVQAVARAEEGLAKAEPEPAVAAAG